MLKFYEKAVQKYKCIIIYVRIESTFLKDEQTSRETI